jgi:hypothetical protein
MVRYEVEEFPVEAIERAAMGPRQLHGASDDRGEDWRNVAR